MSLLITKAARMPIVVGECPTCGCAFRATIDHAWLDKDMGYESWRMDCPACLRTLTTDGELEVIDEYEDWPSPPVPNASDGDTAVFNIRTRPDVIVSFVPDRTHTVAIKLIDGQWTVEEVSVVD